MSETCPDCGDDGIYLSDATIPEAGIIGVDDDAVCHVADGAYAHPE